jgi:glutamate/tyrosine decarboxylase-like PLP-dependent enzyme
LGHDDQDVRTIMLNDLPHTPIPQHGLAREEVLAQLLAMKQRDQDWRGGRVFSLVYSAGDEVHELLQDALSLYSAENGLNVLAFPSIGIMQHDIVKNTATLLGADEPTSGGCIEGYLTSGGTESLLQAVKTARDVARHERGIRHPQIVAAESAHAAFTKAADYFDVELIRVPVGADLRVDVTTFDEACTDATIMVVGSAPTYPHGVVDPIADIAALALRRGILCHVDACMGGFLLPFLVRLGRFSQPFDFRLPGVTSMSADVHKYGYASKGVSVVLYRTHELARHQVFTTSDWLGGFYASTAMAGTRPAGPIAAAWAALMHIGLDGYVELTRTAHDAARTLRAGIESIQGLEVRGDPPATVLAFGAQDPAALDIFSVGERLASDGWYLDRQNRPDSLHATVHAGSAASVPYLVRDLRHAVTAAGKARAADRSTTYGQSG